MYDKIHYNIKNKKLKKKKKMESILGFFFSSATIQGTLQLEPLMVKFLKW